MKTETAFPLLRAILNLAAFHRDHEKFYASAPREQAVTLQRHARTLQALAVDGLLVTTLPVEEDVDTAGREHDGHARHTAIAAIAAASHTLDQSRLTWTSTREPSVRACTHGQLRGVSRPVAFDPM